MIDTYPPLANEDLYVCIDLSEREKEELSGYLEEAGYSAADYQQDSAKLNIREEEETTYSPNFKLTLEYTLTDEGLEVTTRVRLSSTIKSILPLSLFNCWNTSARISREMPATAMCFCPMAPARCCP